MSERVHVLTRVELEGALLSCSHAVLIIQEDSSGAWEIVMLGTSVLDAQRFESRCPADKELLVTTAQGEILASRGCVATVTQGSFLKLMGSAPLRRMVA